MMSQDELNAAFHQYMDELPDQLTGEGNDAPDGIFPDGRYYDWDEDLKAVVETAPDGRRYVVDYQERKLVRVRELVIAAARAD